jgi:parallel beta-helix repeat protein
VFIGHDGGFPTLINCTISGNGGDGLYAEGTSGATLTNCILWGNGSNEIDLGGASVAASYCDIEGGWPGTGNIDADPCFADPENGDYHLKSQGGRWEPNEGRWTTDDVTSPCIDAGDPMSPIGLEPFPSGGRINMGAYGGTTEASKSYFGKRPCQTIVAGDVNGDCEVNFEDFRLMALHWLEER